MTRKKYQNPDTNKCQKIVQILLKGHKAAVTSPTPHAKINARTYTGGNSQANMLQKCCKYSPVFASSVTGEIIKDGQEAIC